MGLILRRAAALSVTLVSVAALTVSGTLSAAAVALSANTTALIMGGTFHPLMGPRDSPGFVKAYLDNAVDGHLDPAFGPGSGPVTNAVAVFTPEDFFPIGRLTLERSLADGLSNLHDCLSATATCVYNSDPAVNAATAAPDARDALMVFGYSQSAVIASLAKRDLIDRYQPGDPSIPFMLVANPMRPNGGIMMRLSGWPTIPILGIPFTGASPTDSAPIDGGGYAYPTVDVVRQYDGLGGDFPVRALNLIATLNALLGYGLLHGETVDVPLDHARFQGRAGDTNYYLIDTDLVPLLQPFQFFIPKPILQALDAPLRVIIEDAYDRDVGPGVPTSANWWPVKDLVGMAFALLASIPVAVDNLVEGFGLGRVLGTARPGTFGIGGPDVAAVAETDLADIHRNTIDANTVDANTVDDNTVGEGASAPVPKPTGRADAHADAVTPDETPDVVPREDADLDSEEAASPELSGEPAAENDETDEETSPAPGEVDAPAPPEQAGEASEYDAAEAA